MTPTPKEGPPTLNGAEKDDKAWEKIGDLMELQEFEEAKAIFMTRCAESAQEVLEQDAKRKAALEELYESALENCSGCKDKLPTEKTHGHGLGVFWAHKTGLDDSFQCSNSYAVMVALDALTPAPQDKKEDTNGG